MMIFKKFQTLNAGKKIHAIDGLHIQIFTVIGATPGAHTIDPALRDRMHDAFAQHGIDLTFQRYYSDSSLWSLVPGDAAPEPALESLVKPGNLFPVLPSLAYLEEREKKGGINTHYHTRTSGMI